jgi:hypothetical protein
VKASLPKSKSHNNNSYGIKAIAGPDQYVIEGEKVLLCGADKTYDQTGKFCAIPSYSWIQIAGPKVNLLNRTNANRDVTFTAPYLENNEYHHHSSSAIAIRFELTITDMDGNTDSDLVNVMVTVKK